METKEVLHILRNPYGYTDEKIREARLIAADELEGWQSVSASYVDRKRIDIEQGNIISGVGTVLTPTRLSESEEEEVE